MNAMQAAARFAALGILLANPAFAHGEHERGGISGTVSAISGDKMMVDTEAGSVAVTLTEETKIVAGEQQVGRDGLRPGDHVELYGSKLPGGAFIARKVTVHFAEEKRSIRPGSP